MLVAFGNHDSVLNQVIIENISDITYTTFIHGYMLSIEVKI